MSSDDAPMPDAQPSENPEPDEAHMSDEAPEETAVEKTGKDAQATETKPHTMSHSDDNISTTTGSGTTVEKVDEQAPFKDKWTVSIERMLEERRRLKGEQRAKTKAIRKTLRQKRKATRNAKKLSDEELAQIVLERRLLATIVEEAAVSASSASSAPTTASSSGSANHKKS